MLTFIFYIQKLFDFASGGFGPMVNNPLDVVKTRLQKQIVKPGKQAKYTGIGQSINLIAKEEGIMALWKGITPR